MAEETRIVLHPSVIIEIADFQARTVAETGNYDAERPPRVMGAIMGFQTETTVEVMSSVTLTFKLDEEKQYRIDDDAFAEDTELYKQIYPEHEVLGWYATATALSSLDLPFHQRFTEYNESPLFLRMNPIPKRSDKALPVTVYRMEFRLVKDKTEPVLVEIPYKVISEQSERLTTAHVLRNKDVPTRGSSIVPQLDELQRAVQALQSRIALLVEYVERVQSGKMKGDEKILEDIQSICNRLPTAFGDKFSGEFASETTNGMVMTYLASMAKLATKVTDSLDLNDLLESGRRGHPLRRFAA